MPRSKVRGGRKAHNKRVKNRNQRVQTDWQKAVNFAHQKYNEMKQQGELQPVQIKVKE